MMLWILTIVEFKVLLLLFNYSLPIRTVFFVLLAVGLAMMIPVPAALGVLEIGQASLFQIAYKKSGLGLVIGLITRVKDIKKLFLSGYIGEELRFKQAFIPFPLRRGIPYYTAAYPHLCAFAAD